MTDEPSSREPSDPSTGFVARARTSAHDAPARVMEFLDRLRGRSIVTDLAVRVYDRDKDAAGTLLGSALALRLFLFFVPLTLTVVGIAGLLGRHADFGSPAETIGVSGTLADEMTEAFDQTGAAPWLATAVGLFFLATTARSLTKALVLSSGLAWRLGGKQKTPVRVVGAVIGIVVGTTLISAIVNRILVASGVAVASVSLGALSLTYVVLWALLFLALPRATTDPGAVLPGAALTGVVIAGLQALSQFYLPGKIDSASSLYGSIGIAVALLGWFFIIGRAITMSFAINAVLFERLGSVSQVIFALPVLRVLPRRSAAFARFFDLDHEPD